MTSEEEDLARDRAFVRHIYVLREDKVRFTEYLKTFPPSRFVLPIKDEGGKHIHFCLRIKKQELLFIELAFKLVVKKPRVRKKKVVSCTGTVKTIRT